jgi:hypothetical protein
MLAWLTIILPTAAGIALAAALIPRTATPWAWWMLVGGSGAGVGIGLASIAYFILFLAGVNVRAAVLAIDFLMMAGAAFLWLRFPTSAAKDNEAHSPAPVWMWVLRGALVVSLLLFALNLAASFQASPHGEYDAIAMWNLKAKFLAADRAALTDLNGPDGPAHPTYPLLLPLNVARGWTLTGDDRSAVPVAIALLCTLAVCAAVFGTVGAIRGEAGAILAVLALLATEGYVSQAATQYADIPLSLYIVSTVGLLAYAAASGWHPRVLWLAGICAGFAAWTKNEGIAFLVLALAAVAWGGRVRALKWAVAGTLPGVLVLAFFKVMTGGRESDFVASAGDAISKIADPGRWAMVAGSFAKSALDVGPVAMHPVLIVGLSAIALGVVPRAELVSKSWLLLAAGGLLVVDFAAYLLSAADLRWHLDTSNNRLIAQVWPALLLVAFLLIQAPAARAATPLPASKQRRAKKTSR